MNGSSFALLTAPVFHKKLGDDANALAVEFWVPLPFLGANNIFVGDDAILYRVEYKPICGVACRADMREGLLLHIYVKCP